ncbi:MAG: hypothetical protein ACRC2T_00265 [Thermoguttaceae bacterium]
MKYTKIFLILPVLFLFAVAGCGKYVPVSGTVKYEDGTPVTAGDVVFATGNEIARGKIGSDGSYRMTSIKPNDGVLRGEHKVYLENVMKIDMNISGEGQNTRAIGSPTLLVDTKYMRPETSGLTCTVKSRTKFDITVEKPE